MTPFTAWADHVIPQARGCTIGMLELTVRNACIKFCELAKPWIEDDSIAVVGGTHTYAITAPADSAVSQIMTAHWDGRTEPLEPQDPDWFDKWLPRWETESGQPEFYYRPDFDSIRLVRTPDADGTVNLRVALKPTETATQVPDFLFAQYRRHITAGTLAELLMMSRKPWSDPARGQMLRGEFISLINAAAANRSRGLTRRPLRSTPQR